MRNSAMKSHLHTSFLTTRIAPAAWQSSNLQFAVFARPGLLPCGTSCSSCCCCRIPDTQESSAEPSGRQKNEASLWLRSGLTRRQIFQATKQLAITSGTAFLLPNFAATAESEGTVKSYTNIEDARRAGDKLREIKDAADGPVLISSTGIKYRELEKGVGNPIGPGDFVSVYYTISRLNGYYLDSMGYGKEGKNDVGETLDFQYGRGLVPEAVEGGMEGMKVGSKRRILVTPDRGWVSPELLPRPTSFFAERRLSDRRTTQSLLIEVELVKAKSLEVLTSMNLVE